MGILISGLPHRHRGAGLNGLEHSRVSIDSTDDVDQTGRSDFVSSASRSRTEKQAQDLSRRPKTYVPHADRLPGVILLGDYGDAEVDLVTPCAGGGVDW